MRFRTIVVAALILVLATGGSLAAYQIAQDARAEAAQTTIEQTDELAVEPDITQKLVSEDDHTPTAYGETITVTYDGQEWNESEEYIYYQDSGEIEFLVDEPGEATIDYRYEIPENQVQDDQIETLTIGTGNVAILAGGLSLVVVFLFIGGFVARRMGVGTSNNNYRGR